MSEPEKPTINWDIQLNFNLPEANEIKKVEIPPPPPVPPRTVIGDSYPKILHRIELLWGTIELHNYLEQTLFTDRSNRQGFPRSVMQALGEIHHEHMRILKLKGVIGADVWDDPYEK